MRNVGVALIGLGSWGGSWSLPAIVRSGNLELVTWLDADPQTVERYRSQIQVPPARSFQEVLENPAVEGIILVVPNHVHVHLATEAAGWGKHVWVEKPIANTLAEADAMIQACEDAGVILQVGHSLRRSPAMRLAKKMVEDGRIGDLVMLEGHHSHRGGWTLTPQMWRWYNDKCPGGPLNVLGTHQIDTMHYIAGPSAEVTAIMTKKFREYEPDEITVVLMRFKNDALGCVSSTYVSPNKVFMSIYGTTGWLEVDFVRGRLTCFDIDSKPEDIPVGSLDALAEEFREFGECVLTGKRPETGGPEGRAAVAVLEAAIRSARTGKTVQV